MSFSSRDFRDCLGQFATGVAVVTTRANNGAKAGITINSFASVSLDPALVLFSIDQRAATHSLFAGECDRFCINILGRQQRELSDLFSSPAQNRWQDLVFEDDCHGVPKLIGNLATFSCKRHAIHDGGDHSIIVGHVQDIAMGNTGDPLLYYGGRYHALGK